MTKFQPSLSTLLQLVLFSTCLAGRGRILSQRQCFAYTYCRRNYHRSSFEYWILNINHGSKCEQGHLYYPIARWCPVSVIIFWNSFFPALQLCDRQPSWDMISLGCSCGHRSLKRLVIGTHRDQSTSSRSVTRIPEAIETNTEGCNENVPCYCFFPPPPCLFFSSSECTLAT